MFLHRKAYVHVYNLACGDVSFIEARVYKIEEFDTAAFAAAEHPLHPCYQSSSYTVQSVKVLLTASKMASKR